MGILRGVSCCCVDERENKTYIAERDSGLSTKSKMNEALYMDLGRRMPSTWTSDAEDSAGAKDKAKGAGLL